MTILRLSLAALLLATPALASAITVDEYLAKTDAIKAQGMLALGSPEVAAIRAEVQKIKTSYRADVDAARAQGKTTMGCPPPAGQGKLDGNDLEKAFRAMPVGVRKRTSLKAGIYQVLRTLYPCK